PHIGQPTQTVVGQVGAFAVGVDHRAGGTPCRGQAGGGGVPERVGHHGLGNRSTGAGGIGRGGEVVGRVVRVGDPTVAVVAGPVGAHVHRGTAQPVGDLLAAGDVTLRGYRAEGGGAVEVEPVVADDVVRAGRGGRAGHRHRLFPGDRVEQPSRRVAGIGG